MEKPEKRLSDQIREIRPPSVYEEAAKLFDTSYTYVSQIAYGLRSGSRGKGAEIKKFLEQQIHIKNKKRQS